MNEFTAQDIVDAYKKVGCRPLRGSYYTTDLEGRECLCPLSVIYRSRGGEDLDFVTRYSNVLPTIAHLLGVDRMFANGLVFGWDGHMSRFYENDLQFQKGKRIGKEAIGLVYQEIGSIYQKI